MTGNHGVSLRVPLPMLDRSLRLPKDRALGRVATVMPTWVSPDALTAAALAVGLAAAGAAALGSTLVAVGAWLVNRLLDGLDGPLARARSTASDRGGYFDMMADTVVYAAVPLGIAVHRADLTVWWCTAALLASFYVNTMSWTYLSAIAEKRAAGAAATGETTSVHMPGGAIEGTETIVLFTAMLAMPGWAVPLFLTMAGLVAITIGQRLWWAVRHL